MGLGLAEISYRMYEEIEQFRGGGGGYGKTCAVGRD